MCVSESLNTFVYWMILLIANGSRRILRTLTVLINNSSTVIVIYPLCLA